MNTPALKIVDFNGTAVVSFIPEDARMAALIDLEVLKRIASYLPMVDWYTVRNRLVTNIDRTNSVEELLPILEAEVAFHKTVNAIQVVNLKEVKADVDEANNIMSSTMLNELD